MTDAMPGKSDRRLLRLAPEDNVCVATVTIEAGRSIRVEGRRMVMRDRIPLGHKVATVPIAAGQKVIKYGAPIGSATADIEPGQWVHTHNLQSDYLPTYTREGSSAFAR